MHVAEMRMIASVGSMIVGSSRSSTRMSPAACMTTPRMGVSFSSFLQRAFSRAGLQQTLAALGQAVPVVGRTARAPLASGSGRPDGGCCGPGGEQLEGVRGGGGGFRGVDREAQPGVGDHVDALVGEFQIADDGVVEVLGAGTVQTH